MTASPELKALRKLARAIEPLIVHRYTGLPEGHPDDDQPDSFIDMTFNSDPNDQRRWKAFLKARRDLRKLQAA